MRSTAFAALRPLSIYLAVSTSLASCSLVEPNGPTVEQHSAASTVDNGIELNGIELNGIELNGIELNGIELNGIELNGIELNGIELNGIELNGIELNGIELNGIELNGIELNGIELNGIELNGIELNGIELNGTTAPDFKKVLHYVVECALDSGDSVTATDLDGSTLIYYGDAGLAPAWKMSVPTADMIRAVGPCVSSRASAADETVITPISSDDFNKILAYMIQCALPDGVTVYIYDFDGVPQPYSGSLGLAPEWQLGPLSSFGERSVSACLAARVNETGTTVQVSLRGPYLTAASALERAVYRHHEGAVWGNMFGPNPAIYACSVDGIGPWGRTCVDGSCGFIDMGPCEAVCDDRDSTDGYFYGCGPDDEPAVINTFLNYSTKLALGTTGTTCIREGDGSIWCWGENTYGEVGDGTTVNRTNGPENLILADAAYMAGGREHTCAVRELTGEALCWGHNEYGKLGVPVAGSQTCNGEPCMTTPVPVQGISDVVQITAGIYHTCGLISDGTVACWGRGDAGRLGNGGDADSDVPVAVTIDSVAYLGTARSSNHTCVVRNNGDVWCWGRGERGQLGDGSQLNQATPVQATLSNAVSVCTGGKHTCARDDVGAVACWGFNSHGQLGDGTQQDRALPINVPLPSAAVAHDCGINHTCALLDDHSVWCWGRNQKGQLGDGTTVKRSFPMPVLVDAGGALSDVDNIAMSAQYSCATRSNGTVQCWGANSFGELGDGTTTNRSKAVPMTVHHCGDSVCDSEMSETCSSCSADCGSC